MPPKIIFKEEHTTYNPLVSIITPVLNGVKYLAACIESVLSQSYPHIEHVFIDGISSDGTLDVLSNYGANYPDRIRFISEPNRGLNDAANRGVQMAKGEIFGLLPSDDMYEPNAIQTVAEFFRVNRGAYFVFDDYNLINEKGEIIRRYRFKDFNQKKMVNGGHIPGVTTFYKREVIEKIGLYESENLLSDLDFAIRAGRVFQIQRIEKVLSNFRVHQGSITTGSWETRRKAFRAACIVSRRYGGSIFSGHSRTYYACLMIDWLRPILGPIYPFITKVLQERCESLGKG
ncbi:hypothetical protein ES703_20359 [subsurface metagenome]